MFPEVVEHLIDLMMDPFGNYLIQKLLDRCSEEQRLAVLQRAAERKELVTVALNTHGTRAVQKLIETLTSHEQVQLVIDALRPGVVSLIRDLNGNHVIQRCLQVRCAVHACTESRSDRRARTALELIGASCGRLCLCKFGRWTRTEMLRCDPCAIPEGL